MEKFHRLKNSVKYYDWGSPDFIPKLLGIQADGKPHAELWMGSHPGSPSRVVLADGSEISLGAFIAKDTGCLLGKDAAGLYGCLPYLFKLLAAGKPLSIQAHPSLEQARNGFELENKAGLAIDAPNRNYKDANHKPEIICALTPFTGMCGFRSPAEIKSLVQAFLFGNCPPVIREGFAPLLDVLEAKETKNALQKFLATVFAIPQELRSDITKYVLESDRQDCEWDLMRRFADLYPNDPAIISPLYLNVFRLQPGEAVFLKAGVLHAYIDGFGVELMANSDNVLRGGLTPKHVDVPELMKSLDFSPMLPQIIKPEKSQSCFTYPSDCREFSLTVMHCTGSPLPFQPAGPSICIVTEGCVCVDGETLQKGESIFVPPAREEGGAVVLQGCPNPSGGLNTLYIASTGNMQTGA